VYLPEFIDRQKMLLKKEVEEEKRLNGGMDEI